MVARGLSRLVGWIALAVLPALISPMEAPASDLAFFGLVPPTDEPEVFAPGIVSVYGNLFRESQLNVWPGGERMFFSRFGPGIQESTVFECVVEDGGWLEPVPTAIFEDSIAIEPGLAPDGQAIYFSLPTLGGHGTHMIYVTERCADGWTEPRRLFRGLYPSVTLDGTIYYTGYIGWKDHIVYRQLVDGEYGIERMLERPVCSTYEDAHPCVAPDGGYLIFDSSGRPHEGDCPLFVTFHGEDGSWSDPVHMGSILRGHRAALPRISPDGKILFFDDGGEIYWISTSVIERLR